MLYTQTGRMYQDQADRQNTQVPLHTVDKRGRQQQDGSSSDSDNSADGTWGERDIGGPVDLTLAMEDYEAMRRELSQMSHQRSRSQSNARRPSSRARRLTRTLSRPQTQGTVETYRTQTRESEAPDESANDEDDFELGEFLKDGHFEKREEGRSAKKVGVVYKNLTVQGVGATATFVKTLPSAVLGVRRRIFQLDKTKLIYCRHSDLIFIDWQQNSYQDYLNLVRPVKSAH